MAGLLHHFRKTKTLALALALAVPGQHFTYLAPAVQPKQTGLPMHGLLDPRPSLQLDLTLYRAQVQHLIGFRVPAQAVSLLLRGRGCKTIR
jgi:hypothetical protein